MEAIGLHGYSMIVIADDETLSWPKTVLGNVQAYASKRGFFVSRMMPRVHEYHLDDNPDLRSCNLVITSLPDNGRDLPPSTPITDRALLANFYGQDQSPRVRYVREVKRVDYGVAPDSEYRFELLEEAGE